MNQLITPKGAYVRPKSTREVVAYLRRAGLRGVLLNKGLGYFCFEGAPTENWIDHTVHVAFLSDLTLGQWLEAFQVLDLNSHNRTSRMKRTPKPSELN